MNWEKLLVVILEVEYVFVDGQVVVVLEFIIIVYGMFYLKNIEMVLWVEVRIREEGVIFVIIVIMDGYLRVGLIQVELEIFGR